MTDNVGTNSSNQIGWRCVAIAAGVLLLATVFLAPGCNGDKRAERAKASARSQQQRQLATSNAMLESVTSHLRDLPDTIRLDLRPPSVILDSTSSQDGQNVMATLGPTPGTGLPIFNFLKVPSGNAGFRSIGVQPGDLLKYYIEFDRETRDRAIETGEIDSATATLVAKDLLVAQVMGENELRIVGGLTLPIEQPHRLEVWRTLDEKMREIGNALGAYERLGEPPLGWEPTPDAEILVQIIEQLNQWIRSRRGPEDWSPAKLIETLDSELREAPVMADAISPAALRATRFADHEGRWIQEAIWLRDAARWASGRRLDPLQRALNLFDWTVRNVVLDDDPRLAANRPWQALVQARGTVEQRAWVFAMLCRQQGLRVLILETPREDEEDPWLWCGLEEEGKLYLFDPQLGLPLLKQPSDLPAPGADFAGEIATLADVQADDALLRTFDLPDADYPVTAELAKQAIACVVADPFSLAWRTAEFEEQLSGEDALRLSLDADTVADEVRQISSVSEVKLWSAPFKLLRLRLSLPQGARGAVMREFVPLAWRPKLWKARVLHLRGLRETEQDARRKGDALYDPVNDHLDAGQLYTDRSVRPRDRALERQAADKRMVYSRAKANSAYWLGLLQYELGKYPSSQQWLERTGGDETIAARRADGVQYNRARALEAAGELEAAADLLASSESPQRHGDRLRAAWLAERAAAATDSASTDSDP